MYDANLQWRGAIMRMRIPSKGMALDDTGSSEIDTGQQLSTRQLSCTICLGSYKDPRILKCSHSFCRRCLVRVLEGDDCPESSLRKWFYYVM